MAYNPGGTRPRSSIDVLLQGMRISGRAVNAVGKAGKYLTV